MSCISKWFYTQAKSTCPMCRKEMEGAADVWSGEGEEDSEESDDETESTMSGESYDRLPEYVSFNNAEFNTMLVEHGIRPVPADKWQIFEQTYMPMTPEYDGELRIRMWKYDLENYFLGRGEIHLTTEMWELIVDRQVELITDSYLSATADYSHPLRLPNRPCELQVTLYLMDNGSWDRDVLNPEEYTGVSTTRPTAVMASATKIQAVWRGFKARADRVLRVSAA
jgi:hypothetical protein